MHLMAMWIHPKLRGTGVVDALVAFVKAWAAEVGATEVCLNVLENNERARRCYARAGFRATGQQGMVEKTGDMAIEMVWKAQLWPKHGDAGTREDSGIC